MKFKEIRVRFRHYLAEIVVAHRHSPRALKFVLPRLHMLVIQVAFKEKIAGAESTLGAPAEKVRFAVRLDSTARTSDDYHLRGDYLPDREVAIDNQALREIIPIHHLALGHLPFLGGAERGLDLPDTLDHVGHFLRQKTYFVIIALQSLIYGKMLLNDSRAVRYRSQDNVMPPLVTGVSHYATPYLFQTLKISQVHVFERRRVGRIAM